MSFILQIEQPTFEELRMIFNKILQQSIDKMQENESEECAINIKFKVSLKDCWDDVGEIYKSPRFKYDVSSEFKQKIEAGGEVFGDYQLKFDDLKSCYVMAEVPKRQMKIY